MRFCNFYGGGDGVSGGGGGACGGGHGEIVVAVSVVAMERRWRG